MQAKKGEGKLMTRVEEIKTSRRRLLMQVGVSLGAVSVTPVLLSQPAAAGGGGGGGGNGGGGNILSNRRTVSAFQLKLFKKPGVLLLTGALILKASPLIGIGLLLIGAKQLHSVMKETKFDALEFVLGRANQMLQELKN